MAGKLCLKGGRKTMKILIVEDTILKYSDIKRTLDDLYHPKIDHAQALEPAKEMYLDALESEPYDLVITDVHFPIKEYGAEDPDAGFQMIDFIKEKRPEQPIIVCSSVRYSVQDVLGVVLYSDKTDLRFEFKKLVDKIK